MQRARRWKMCKATLLKTPHILIPGPLALLVRQLDGHLVVKPVHFHPIITFTILEINIGHLIIIIADKLQQPTQK